MNKESHSQDKTTCSAMDSPNLENSKAGHQAIESQRYIPHSFDKNTVDQSKFRSSIGKSNIITHNEIYQKFAEETEQLKKKQQNEYECHQNNNENNNRNHSQDLHFAKRLTWNLPVTEDKMQTSTDGNETPTMETINANLNLSVSQSSSLNQHRSQFQNIQGIIK